ncbi:MAG: hypothetical protein ISS34_06215 [Candidatus Omnitrophica bacterium]|nr:hypothetical protein [Candidatus Omnitrophota bacterium]
MGGKRGIPLLLIILISVFISAPFAFAAKEEEPSVKEKNILEEQLGDIMPTLVRKHIGKLKLDLSTSMAGGYDANVNLQRYDEDGSVFMQNTLGIAGKYPISDIYTLKGSYDFTSIKYFKFSDPDLIDNTLGVGLDTKIDDNFLWSVDYMADFVGFPHDEQSEYDLNQVGTSLKQDITDWLYQKMGYEFSYKHFPKSKTRNSRGVMLDRDRGDKRNTVFYQLGAYIGDKTFLKSETSAFINESNELFLDYYDYRSLKTKLTLAHLITDKLYGMTSFTYQYKAYYKRSVSDREFDQRDHLFVYGGSLFYDVIPQVSIGTSFDYRKNHSGENVEQYEDYIISSGVYCSF